ncbi:FPL domain-containing protein [Trichonephila inaurata madagascariensis]|uniref:FPL domain-containing protein n=1 Tax=Trichonephila inaurata madagascariensis TaxID=2747483 RepID=A0A8X6X482_9ARAC|nr:FPL domain-containing protein [Trichonephila inaurata madagascariensis]
MDQEIPSYASRKFSDILIRAFKELKCSEQSDILWTEDLSRFFPNGPNSISSEDKIGQYVTILKILIRKLSPGILHELFDSATKSFPILEWLLKYSFHEDTMIKNAVRLSLLVIFKECQGEVQNYVVQYGIYRHCAHLASFLKCMVIDLRDSLEKRQENTAKLAHLRFEENIEYIDDILCLECEDIVNRFRTTFFKKFVLPVLFLSLAKQTDGASVLKSAEISLFLIGNLIQILRDKELKNDIIDMLLPTKMQDTTIQRFSISLKTITDFRSNVVQNIKRIITNTRQNLLLINVVRTLGIIMDFLVSCNDHYRFFIAYTAFFDSLIWHFQPETSDFSKLYNTKLGIIAAVLESVATASIAKEGTPWLEIRNHFSRILQEQYLAICQKVKFENIQEFATVLDIRHQKFLKGKEYIQKVFDDISCSISISCNLQKYENLKSEEIDIISSKLFHLRYLCLLIYRKQEKILPLLASKIRIGDKVSMKNFIPCDKFIHGNTYASKHFLKLISNQILILQDAGNNKDGIVIFCSHYKDIVWTKLKKNLILREIKTKRKNYVNKRIVSSSVQVKFQTSSQIDKISKALAKAKNKQNEILRRKLEDLLETEYIQNNKTSNDSR